MAVETQSATHVTESSIEALLRAGVRLLAGSSESPRLDAELLLAHVTGRDRAALFAHREAKLAAPDTRRFMEALHARLAGRPVAQIIGHREFWTLDVAVTPDVLTPRPDTEVLVERALSHLPAVGARRVLDLGTGSGAVALAIARERPDCNVLATDASPAALAVAAGNASANGIGNVRFATGHWYEAASGQRFDVIVSNPPYVAAHEWAQADPALAFEPRAALDGGADGLDALRAIVGGAKAHLEPDGWLLLEHGHTQGPAVRALLAAAQLTALATHADLAGLPRVTEGRASSH